MNADDNGIKSRAQGCLMGQLAGDSLGGLVEFQTPEEIRRDYPNGVRLLTDGGTWNILAGQPTDDSEMALLLARMLVKNGTYDRRKAKKEYVYWLESDPFDCGRTIYLGLEGHPNYDSQANGAMMRISPLGIFGSSFDLNLVAEWARQDAEITHPNTICLRSNSLFAMAIARAVSKKTKPEDLYEEILLWARDLKAEPILMDTIRKAEQTPSDDYVEKQGWVLIAFQNALWQLLHASNPEEGIVDTVMRGGDTDTNAAICGALLGSVYGIESIPSQWSDKILTCRPDSKNPDVYRPRPECFWPVDAMELAEKLTFHS